MKAAAAGVPCAWRLWERTWAYVPCGSRHPDACLETNQPFAEGGRTTLAGQCEEGLCEHRHLAVSYRGAWPVLGGKCPEMVCLSEAFTAGRPVHGLHGVAVRQSAVGTSPPWPLTRTAVSVCRHAQVQCIPRGVMLAGSMAEVQDPSSTLLADRSTPKLCLCGVAGSGILSTNAQQVRAGAGHQQIRSISALSWQAGTAAGALAVRDKLRRGINHTDIEEQKARAYARVQGLEQHQPREAGLPCSEADSHSCIQHAHFCCLEDESNR